LGAEDQRVLEAVPLVRAASVTAIARTAGLAPASVTASLHRLASLGFVRLTGDAWRQA
jgi:DNA-binding IclR family transcriptional regulator